MHVQGACAICLRSIHIAQYATGGLFLEQQYEMALESASFIESRLPCKPQAAVILGSGLGPFVERIRPVVDISYRDIPNFPPTTVKGHEGRLIIGMAGEKCILIFKGRYHYYEGYDISQVVFPVRVMKVLGIRNLVVTNAAGAVNTSFSPGDLMLIKDHIGLFAPSPLRGRNSQKFGTRFPDMTEAYSRKLMERARKSALECGIMLKEGVYAFVRGPMYETPAEISALRLLGADAVGMSTVPEVIVARHCNIEVLGISCITNMAAGISESPLNHEEVTRIAATAGEKFGRLLISIFEDW